MTHEDESPEEIVDESTTADQSVMGAEETAEDAGADVADDAGDLDTTAVGDAVDKVSDVPAVSDGATGDEPEPTPVVASEESPAPVAEVAPVSAPAPDTVEAYLKERFPKMAEIPAATKGVIQRMATYTATMAKGRVVGETAGAQQQRELYMTFMAALTGPDDSVTASLEAIAWFFRQNLNSCFRPSHAFRYMGSVKLTKDQGLQLQAFINLFSLCCDPGTRQHTLKQVDLAKATQKISDLRAHDRLLAFFTAQ